MLGADDLDEGGPAGPDTDGDDTIDALDPSDEDTDDDGVPDGNEPGLRVDTDGDGLTGALDPDSDGDGLFDGTEMGLDCTNPATNSNEALADNVINPVKHSASTAGSSSPVNTLNLRRGAAVGPQ